MPADLAINPHASARELFHRLDWHAKSDEGKVAEKLEKALKGAK